MYIFWLFGLWREFWYIFNPDIFNPHFLEFLCDMNLQLPERVGRGRGPWARVSTLIAEPSGRL